MNDLAATPERLGAFAAMAWAWAVEFVPKLASAAILLLAGLILARWVGRLIASFSIRNLHIDETIRPVIAAAVRYGISIIVIVAALGQLGVQTASILAVLGAAGLAIGLALQGTLSNIAAGLMLLWLRPFRVGEYIETATVSGVVREIGLFATTLDTFDGLYRFVPNSEIWNKPLVNHSRNRGRMGLFTLERYSFSRIEEPGHPLHLDSTILSLLVIVPIALIVAGALVFVVGRMRRL